MTSTNLKIGTEALDHLAMWWCSTFYSCDHQWFALERSIVEAIAKKRRPKGPRLERVTNFQFSDFSPIESGRSAKSSGAMFNSVGSHDNIERGHGDQNRVESSICLRCPWSNLSSSLKTSCINPRHE